jgi:hypothetical protein
MKVPFRHFSGETEEKLKQACHDNLCFCSESKQAPPEYTSRPLFLINLVGNFLSYPVRMKQKINPIILKSNGRLGQWTKSKTIHLNNLHNFVKSFKLILLSLISLQLTRTRNKQKQAPNKLGKNLKGFIFFRIVVVLVATFYVQSGVCVP